MKFIQKMFDVFESHEVSMEQLVKLYTIPLKFRGDDTMENTVFLQLYQTFENINDKISAEDRQHLLNGLMELTFYPYVNVNHLNFEEYNTYNFSNVKLKKINNNTLAQTFTIVTKDVDMKEFIGEHYHKHLSIQYNDGKVTLEESIKKDIQYSTMLNLNDSEINEVSYINELTYSNSSGNLEKSHNENSISDITLHPYAHIVPSQYLLNPTQKNEPFSKDRLKIFQAIATSSQLFLEEQNYFSLNCDDKAQFITRFLFPSFIDGEDYQNKDTMKNNFLVFLISHSLYNPQFIEDFYQPELQLSLQKEIAFFTKAEYLTQLGMFDEINSLKRFNEQTNPKNMECFYDCEKIEPNIDTGYSDDFCITMGKSTNFIQDFSQARGNHPLIQESCEYLLSHKDKTPTSFIYFTGTDSKQIVASDNQLADFFEALRFILPHIESNKYLSGNSLYQQCLNQLSLIPISELDLSVTEKFIAYSYLNIAVDILSTDEQPIKVENYIDWIYTTFENLDTIEEKQQLLNIIDTKNNISYNDSCSNENIANILFKMIHSQSAIIKDDVYLELDKIYPILFEKILLAENASNQHQEQPKTKAKKF